MAGKVAELGHDGLDLVKQDIDVAEHEAIRRTLSDELLPTVLCVELDQPEPLGGAAPRPRPFVPAGTTWSGVEGLNLTFHDQSAAG